MITDQIRTSNENKNSNVRKRNIQAVLGLLKMKNALNENEGKSMRIQKNDFQKKILKEVYKLTKFPSKQTREDLALLLNHTNRGIQIWFQNQRNSKDENSELSETIDKRKETVDIITLIEIIERNISEDKKSYWNRFINYNSAFY